MDVQSNAGELVTCDIDNGVAVLTWNRPERRNSWSVPMEEEYFALLRRCTADPGVRAIVVTGAGSTFCPGMDSAALSGISTGATETRPQDRQPAIFPATVSLAGRAPGATPFRWHSAAVPARTATTSAP